jgi:Flp pilus assembly protein TadG
MRLKEEQGQSMVEFALVLPILILIVCIIIDLGWIFGNQITLNNACREAARYSSIHEHDSTANDDSADALSVFRNAAPSLSAPSLTLINPDTDSVKISVTASVPVLTGVTSTLLGKSTVTIRAESTMKLEP